MNRSPGANPAHRGGPGGRRRGNRPADIGDAVLAAVDDEPVQVLTAPAERGLQDGVQLGDRGVGGDQQAPPDQRADPVHHHPQLVERSGTRASCSQT